jgi:hypothetical protein
MPYAPAALYHQADSWLSCMLEVESILRAIVWLELLGKQKSPISSGIKPTNFQLIAEWLK